MRLTWVMNKRYWKLSFFVLACSLLLSFSVRASGNNSAFETAGDGGTLRCTAADSCQVWTTQQTQNVQQYGRSYVYESVNVQNLNEGCHYHVHYGDNRQNNDVASTIDMSFSENTQLTCLTCDNTVKTNGAKTVRMALHQHTICSDSCEWEVDFEDPEHLHTSISIGLNCDSQEACDYTEVFKQTGQTCTDNVSMADSTLSSSPKGCTSGVGADCTGQYCGTVNGKTTCVDGIKDGECGATPNGSTVCVETPHPAGDSQSGSGRPSGDPDYEMRSPDDNFIDPSPGETGGSGQVAVWTPNTGGASQIGTGHWNDGSKGAGNGTGNGNGNGNGTCTGDDCSKGDGSSDGTFGKGNYGRNMDAVPSFAVSFGLIQTALESHLATPSFEDPSASCPSFGFTLGGTSYSFSTTLCAAYDQAASLIGALMTFIWGFVGFRIVWSA